jgi:hypothetical protein
MGTYRLQIRSDISAVKSSTHRNVWRKINYTCVPWYSDYSAQTFEIQRFFVTQTWCVINISSVPVWGINVSHFVSLTSWSWTLPEKLPVVQLLENYPTFYGTRRFITVFFQPIIHSSVALQPFVGPWPLLQFRNIFYTDGRTPWMSDQPVTRPLTTHRATQTQDKRTHRHPCLEWHSNPRSQLSTKRRQLMPKTARPLWSVMSSSTLCINPSIFHIIYKLEKHQYLLRVLLGAGN